MGAAVAAGEFLCAGQIYLASLLQTVQAGASFRGTLSLLVYCGGFILPSVVILLLIARGSSADRIARFMAEHLALVKLLTALMMIALILVAWLLV